MKKLSIAIALLASSTTASADAETLTFCYEDTNNPPFYFSTRDRKKDAPGVTVELIREAAELSGLKTRFHPLPWERCLESLKSGRVDGAFDLSFKKKREEYAVYPKNALNKVDQKRYLHELAYYLYTVQDSGISWDGSEITGLSKPVAAISGYSIAEDLRNSGYEVKEGRSQRNITEMLIRGDVDAFAQQKAIANALLESRAKRYGKIQAQEKPLRSKLYYLVFGKKFYAEHRRVAESMWNNLQRLNKQGMFDVIARKYSD